MAAISAPTRMLALRGISILTLDNDVRIATLVRVVLQELGFQKIFVGHDGLEGLRIMRRQAIDMVITDWPMQTMDGMEFVKYLRTSPKSPNPYIPVILLTGRAEIEDVEFARDNGITEFVVKPFTVKRLVDRIVAVIDNPRSFVLTKKFRGPDRRRRSTLVPETADRRRNTEKKK